MYANNNFDKNKSGYIFNIQHYSVHDGPGIRTIVFLQGCPLRCKWCSNPESQQYLPVLAYNENKCIGIDQCINCIQACSPGAITRGNDNRIIIDRELCNECLLCAGSCPAKALITYGKLRDVNEVLDVVEGDSMFYARSGGGLTLSGGEPLMQPEFSVALLKEAKRRRINTAMETSGYAKWSVLEDVSQYLDYILYDIKCLDSNKHQEFTGVPNELILANLSKLCAKYPSIPILVRTAVIPGFNDTEEDIKEIINLIKELPNVNYELLPYHPMGQPKYAYLGKEYAMSDTNTIVAPDKMKLLNQLVDDAGIGLAKK